MAIWHDIDLLSISDYLMIWPHENISWKTTSVVSSIYPTSYLWTPLHHHPSYSKINCKYFKPQIHPSPLLTQYQYTSCHTQCMPYRRSGIWPDKWPNIARPIMKHAQENENTTFTKVAIPCIEGQETEHNKQKQHKSCEIHTSVFYRDRKTTNVFSLSRTRKFNKTIVIYKIPCTNSNGFVSASPIRRLRRAQNYSSDW